MRYIFFIVLLLILWFFAGGLITETKNHAAYGISQVLLWPRWWLRGLINPALTEKGRQELILENKNLEAEVFRLNKLISEANTEKYIPAKIHSKFPFNKKSVLSVNVGSSDGVEKGMAAVVGGSIFLGKVDEVFENYSLIRTVFSSGWQLPVRLGNEERPALMRGGSEIKITLLGEGEEVHTGDVAFTASDDLPYGLTIGELRGVGRERTPAVFKDIFVETPYNLSELTEIWLLKQ